MRVTQWCLIALLSVVMISTGHAQERTELSQKAGRLRIGMTRSQVISLLGPATWAAIPGDQGEYALPDPRIRLELFWKNGRCGPVAVMFDTEYRVSGWDEGRVCFDTEGLTDPSEEYLCEKADRKRYCTLEGGGKRREWRVDLVRHLGLDVNSADPEVARLFNAPGCSG